MKELQLLSSKITSIDTAKRASWYIGKQVRSQSGARVGRVRDIVLLKDVFVGVIVNRRYKLFISKEFFSPLSGDAIMLTIDPVYLYLKKVVFDSEGKKLGRVVDIQRKGNANSFDTLIVKKNIISRALPIPKQDIEVCEANIILNKSY